MSTYAAVVSLVVSIISLHMCFVSWMGKAIPSKYARRQYSNTMSFDELASIDTGYIAFEFIDKMRGRMLSDIWHTALAR
ncbi:hypothetical protein N7454_001659 [Penicillium verhagenii]|nr:hypothetical protein N7454_001659 [Penicillium verhagenii]